MDLRKYNTISAARQLGVAFGCAALVAGSAMFGQWVFNVELRYPRPHGIGIVGPIISFVVTAILVSIIRFRSQQRRKARLVRAQIVANCNHEIRNALQAMLGLNYQHESLSQIEAAVKRIDTALRDLLPQLEGDDGRPGNWEIVDGRLVIMERKVKQSHAS